jgi:hypothetical protein
MFWKKFKNLFRYKQFNITLFLSIFPLLCLIFIPLDYYSDYFILQAILVLIIELTSTIFSIINVYYVGVINQKDFNVSYNWKIK